MPVHKKGVKRAAKVVVRARKKAIKTRAANIRKEERVEELAAKEAAGEKK